VSIGVSFCNIKNDSILRDFDLYEHMIDPCGFKRSFYIYGRFDEVDGQKSGNGV
jgi:hypothetical protein